MTDTDDVREQVRARYAAAAAVAGQQRRMRAVIDPRCCSAGVVCGGDGEVDDAFGAGLYSADEQAELPADALAASLGCGNPIAVAELRPGETRAGPRLRRRHRRAALRPPGRPDRLRLRRRHDRRDARPRPGQRGQGRRDQRRVPQGHHRGRPAARRLGRCGHLQLRDQPVRPTSRPCSPRCSGCSQPGGRIGISDVVAEDHLTARPRAERGSYVGCIAGALSRSEYLDGLAAAGFVAPPSVHLHPRGRRTACTRRHRSAPRKPLGRCGPAEPRAGPPRRSPRRSAPRFSSPP